MWRYPAVWLCDKILSRLPAPDSDPQGRETLRGELRKVFEYLRMRCQPPVDAVKIVVAAPAEDAHWLRRKLHPIAVPFLYAWHFLNAIPGWLICATLVAVPAASALVYIEYLNHTPVATNVEDAFRHQQGRPLARILFVREWSSSDGVARLLGAILRNSLNSEVIFKPYPQDDLKNMLKLLADNQADIVVSVWLPETHKELVRDYAKDTVDLGPYLVGARMGLAVPQYAPAKNLTDIKAADFGGVIYGIDPESGLNRKIRLALEDYGLEGFSLVEQNERTLLMQARKAIQEKKNIVFAAWTPDWLFGEYPLRMLDDPREVFGAGEEIHLFVSKSFAENFPVLTECLRLFRISPQELSELLAQIREEKVPGEAVRDWVTNHRQTVNQWIEPMVR